MEQYSGVKHDVEASSGVNQVTPPTASGRLARLWWTTVNPGVRRRDRPFPDILIAIDVKGQRAESGR